MEKKTNNTLIITTILCLLPIILAIVLYDKLPAQVAIHFNSAGAPDNYLPKAIAVFGLPIGLAVINLYSHFRLNNDPKVENTSFALKQIGYWAVPLGSLIIMPITLFIAIGAEIPITIIVTAVVGLIIVACGNYLPKCKRNYTIGIKLPWTLDSQDNWNKTHRFAGFVWVALGIAFIANAFFQSTYVLIGIIVLLVALPPIYSYITYKNQLSANK